MSLSTHLPFPYDVYELLAGSEHLHFGYFPGGYIDDDAEASQQRLTDSVLEMLPPGGGRVLDVGCGFGRTAVLLARKGYEVRGISPDPVLHERALDRTSGSKELSLSFRCASFLEFAGSDDLRYDIILMQEVLQYLRPLPGVFDGCRRLLKKGGYLLFCDQLLERLRLRGRTVVHWRPEILFALFMKRFRIVASRDITLEASPTYEYVLREVKRKREQLLERLRGEGKDADRELEEFTRVWREQYSWSRKGYLGYGIYLCRKWLAG